MSYKDKEKKREADKRYYEKNKKELKKKQKIKDLKRHKEIREWMAEYKSNLSCEICSENESVCMDFHHLDPNKKDKTIAKAIQHRWSKTRILKELEKCVVLCANCHRKLHAELITLPASLTQSG